MKLSDSSAWRDNKTFPVISLETTPDSGFAPSHGDSVALIVLKEHDAAIF